MEGEPRPQSGGLSLRLGTDKLAASGWGQPKQASHSGSGVPATSSAAVTARSADAMSKQGGKPGKISLEDHINLEVMLKLKETFTRADADGGGDLDIEEFVEAFDGVLGQGNEEELRKLFMRIDANSDGTVDWDEFSSFILLENQGAANLRESESVLQFHPSKMPDRVVTDQTHRSPMMQICYVPAGSGAGERYATAGRDGTVRLWSAKDLSLQKTIINGTAWCTSLVFTPRTHRLAVSSFARTIKLYDVMNSDICGSASELDHAAYTMDCAQLDKSFHELVIVGDIGGGVTVFSLQEQSDQGANAFVDAEVKREDQYRFVKKWKEELHTDWVSRVKFVPDLAGVVTSSLDKTLSIVDIERRTETRRMVGHTKGVHSFEWTNLYKFVASAGMDRKVMLWNPFSCKHIAVLQGHNASVLRVAINERDNQIISMSVDKTIKVWDIRNHKCMQTFHDDDTYRPENTITAMMYDNTKRWLVTGNTTLKTWPLRSVINKTSGAHSAPVSRVLYSPNFSEAISADHAGTVCVWVASTGKLRFRFTRAHSDHRITAMTLDSNCRRLLTGADNGQLKMWNFSSGACIKTMNPKGAGMEVTGITCTQGMYFNNHILAVGWDRRITFYEDGEGKELSPVRQMGQKGHSGDVLSVSIMEGSGTLATSGYEGHILVWNVDSGAVKQRLVPPGLSQQTGVDGGPPEDVAIEKIQFLHGRLHHVLVAVGADRWLRVWDALEGRLLLGIKTTHRIAESIVSLACRPDNRYIATGDSGGWIKVWDISKLSGERVPEGMGGIAVREHACWHAHKGTVADLSWSGQDKPYLLSCSSDMNVTSWRLDGAKVGDFGKDEWDLADETTWISHGSEQLVANPNVGVTDRGSFSRQLRHILSPTRRSPGPSPPHSPARLPSGDDGESEAEEGPLPSLDESMDPLEQERSEDTEDVPSSLVMGQLRALPQRSSVGGRKGKDPRFGRVFTPDDSKRLNHTATQGREKTSIHHLVHVSDLKELPGFEGGRTGSGAGILRPHTVAGGGQSSLDGRGALRPGTANTQFANMFTTSFNKS